MGSGVWAPNGASGGGGSSPSGAHNLQVRLLDGCAVFIGDVPS